MLRRLLALLLLALACPAFAAASFDHFTGTSAPGGWTPVTASNGVLCMNGTLTNGSGGSCPGSVSGESFYNTVTAANADVAYAYSPTISKNTSAIYWLKVRASASTFNVDLIDKATPAAGTNGATYGSTGYAVGRVQLTTTGAIVARWDNAAARNRTEWSGSAWAAPTQTAGANVSDNFQLIGLEVDGPGLRYRWHVYGNSGTGSTTPSYALYHHTTTDWVLFSFHEGTAATYCNPTCTNLRLGFGDPLNDAQAATGYVEWYAVDEGTLQHAWLNIRDNGGTWSIRHFWGYPSASGFVERFVPEDRATNTVAVGGGGAWDDSQVKDQQITLGSNGTYYMVYGGSDGAKFQVGVATASTPGGTWTKHANNPIVPFSAATVEDQTLNPFLVEDFSEPDAAKRWKLFYVGADTSSPIVFRAYVRTCSAPPDNAACDTAGEWSAKVELAGPGSGGAIDDRGWGRIYPYRFFGRPHLIGGVVKNGTPARQESYASGADFSAALTKSGVVTVASDGSNCDFVTNAALTTTRTVPTSGATSGCSADQFVVIDDDATSANYHRNRILNVVSSSSLTLYHREDGMASGAAVRGVEAFYQNDAGVIREYAPGQWVRYGTCFDPMTGAGSNDAYSENTCTWTAPTPLGPWTIAQLASPVAIANAFGAQHSLENLSLINGPMRAAPMFVGAR